MDYLKEENTKEDKENAKETALQIVNWRTAVKDGATKNVLYDILSMCQLYSDNFLGNSQTDYLLGRRSIGLEIIAMLEKIDPTFYPHLLLEMIKKGEKK